MKYTIPAPLLDKISLVADFIDHYSEPEKLTALVIVDFLQSAGLYSGLNELTTILFLLGIKYPEQYSRLRRYRSI